jgi:hypothetical protein
MQCRQILVDWARMRDTGYNIGMTWSNGKSPKFLSEKLSTFKEKKSAINANWFKIFAQKCNHNKKPSQRGFDGRLQDYE